MTNTVRSYRRNYNLKALYAHGNACQCGKCTNTKHPIPNTFAAGEFPNNFARIPDGVEDDFLERLYKGPWGRNQFDKVLWQEYYTRLRQFAEAGIGRKLTDPKDWQQFDLMERIKRNAGTFAGGKVNTITEQLKRYRSLPKQDFNRIGRGLLRAHNRDYLEAEVQTALAAANSADKWQDIQRLAYLYPNLRYETAGDERVRQSHRSLDQVVYPVNHAFWDTWMPPNGWRCRCIVVQTDEPTTNVGDDFDLEIPKAFNHNPGRTGKLFADDHPYFDWSENDLSQIAKRSENFRADWEMNEVYQLAAADVGERIRLKGMSKPAEVTQDFITATLGSKHIETAIKNDLLTVLVFLEGAANLLTIEGDAYIYNMVVSGFTFTLRIQNNVFEIIS